MDGWYFSKESIGLVKIFTDQSGVESSTKGVFEETFEEMKPTGSFQGKLYPYQEKGVSWLYSLYQKRAGALLSDEMGLGKTVQVLAFVCNIFVCVRYMHGIYPNWEVLEGLCCLMFVYHLYFYS